MTDKPGALFETST